jgi:lysophospholipase L1-like esterase/dienelactone hydrolase
MDVLCPRIRFDRNLSFLELQNREQGAFQEALSSLKTLVMIRMNLVKASCAFLLLLLQFVAAAPSRILFLGDSITHSGHYVSLTEEALLRQFPDADVEVLNLGISSETVSGLSEDGHADGKFPRPNLHERLQRVLTTVQPTLVIACYGMNCGIYHPLSDERFNAFQAGMRQLRDAVRAQGATLIHLTPPVFDALPIATKVLPAGLAAYPQPFAEYDQVLETYSIWLMRQQQQGWTVVDLHAAMKSALLAERKQNPAFTFAKDGVHPNESGHEIMFQQTCSALGLSIKPANPELLNLVKQKQEVLKLAWLSHTKHLRPGIKPGLPLAEAQAKAVELNQAARALARTLTVPRWQGRQSDWHGFKRHDFPLMGTTLTVVSPKTPAPGMPWCWEGEFFGHQPAPAKALLEQGHHIVYLQAQNLYGAPKAAALWNAAYTHLVMLAGFHPKPAITGLSRGGLYAWNWAAQNPQRVRCLYLDAPVLDFKSWPAGKGKAAVSAKEWAQLQQVHGFESESAALAYSGNPIDQTAALAKAKVPVLIVYGDQDTVVPWEENGAILAKQYEQAGGPITLIPKPGIGHHPHGLTDPKPIVDFLLK